MVDIVVPHTYAAGDITVTITNTLNQGTSDESWGWSYLTL
jgi:hypothetical protein